MKNFPKKSPGFTVVELMVVVAIVGILATIGRTNYMHFVAKGRQTEAKVALSAIYMAEQAYFSEFYTYTGCLKQMGYVPDSSTRYYLVGFSYNTILNNTGCGPSGGYYCSSFKFTTPAPGATLCNAADPNHNSWPADISASDIAYSSTVAENNGSYYNKPGNWHLDANQALGTSVASKTFVAGAAGAISSKPANTAMKGEPFNVNSGAMADGWTINEQKQLINLFPGP